MKTIAFAVVALLIGVVGAYFLIVSKFDGEIVNRDAIAAIEKAAGGTWDFGEPARLMLGFKPMVMLRDLRLANVDWATRAEFFSVAYLEVDSDWVSLIKGDFQIRELRLSGIELNLETDGDGNNNWSGDSKDKASGVASEPDNKPTNIGLITLSDINIRFYSGWGELERELPLEEIQLRSGGLDQVLTVSLKALFSDQPMVIAGQLGSPNAMFGGQAFVVDLDGNYSGPESAADVQIDGSIGSLTGLKDVALDISLNAKSLNEVGSISGFALPRDTPVRITAKIGSTDAGVNLQDYVLRIGHAIIRPQDGD
ncbi:MAG: hypothetical protein ACI9BW_000745 [Gammaproteobacteria bacterium]|jgi:uncharacterized protein involved in outer membrane biogenesis